MRISRIISESPNSVGEKYVLSLTKYETEIILSSLLNSIGWIMFSALANEKADDLSIKIKKMLPELKSVQDRIIQEYKEIK